MAVRESRERAVICPALAGCQPQHLRRRSSSDLLRRWSRRLAVGHWPASLVLALSALACRRRFATVAWSPGSGTRACPTSAGRGRSRTSPLHIGFRRLVATVAWSPHEGSQPRPPQRAGLRPALARPRRGRLYALHVGFRRHQATVAWSPPDEGTAARPPHRRLTPGARAASTRPPERKTQVPPNICIRNNKLGVRRMDADNGDDMIATSSFLECPLYSYNGSTISKPDADLTLTPSNMVLFDSCTSWHLIAWILMIWNIMQFAALFLYVGYRLLSKKSSCWGQKQAPGLWTRRFNNQVTFPSDPAAHVYDTPQDVPRRSTVPPPIPPYPSPPCTSSSQDPTSVMYENVGVPSNNGIGPNVE